MQVVLEGDVETGFAWDLRFEASEKVSRGVALVEEALGWSGGAASYTR